MRRFLPIAATALLLTAPAPPPDPIEVHFGPEEALESFINGRLRQAPPGDEVCVAMYTLTSPTIVETLTARTARLRLLVDHGMYVNPDGGGMREAVDALRDAGAQVRFYCSQGRACRNSHPEHDANFLHHKFAVLGTDAVITGSANWTQNGTNRGNCENVVILEDRDAARAFRREFDRLWNLTDGHVLRGPIDR